MSTEVSIRWNAAAKMLLHAAKYPHLAVNGILLSAANQPENSELIILNAVPLFHQQIGLAAMLEVALVQIEKFYKTKDMVICGYYQANENLQDNVPDFVAMKTAEKIAENMVNACLIMLDNKKLTLHPDVVPFNVSRLTAGGKWKNLDKTSINVEHGALSITSRLLLEGTKITDFDNHLDDLELDWGNENIDNLIIELCS